MIRHAHNSDPSATSGNIRRRRGAALLITPLLLLAACSSEGSASSTNKSADKDGTEITQPGTDEPTNHFETSESERATCETGEVGQDSFTTGKSYSIGDDGPTKTWIDEYGGFEFEGEWQPKVYVEHRSMSDETARAEGWTFVTNTGSGIVNPDLGRTIDQLQCKYGIENVTTGNAVDENGEAVGIPDKLSLWVREKVQEGDNSSSVKA